MKKFKTITILFIIMFSVSAYHLGAQAYDYPRQDNEGELYIPGGFIGTSTGINNINGLLGVNIEALIFRNATLVGGAGIGSWGYKFTLDARYYLNYPKGIYFGLGYSMATGMQNVPIDLDTENPGGETTVEVDLNQAQTLNITSGIQWRFGKRFRMGLLYGYSLPLQTQAWELVSPEINLTEDSESILDIMTPGGIILGFGISFGIY